MGYLQASVAQLEVFEGKIPWMYLDPKGNVTVGVGLEVPTVQMAVGLSFQMPHENCYVPATAAEITADFNRVKSLGAGKVAAAYRWGGSTFLEDDAIEALLLQTVTTLDHQMPMLYPKYANWPDAGKLAVLDMAYNMGVVGLRKYLHMNFALNQFPPNWKLAASQCEREKDDPAFERRNIWTEYQFSLCAAA